MGVADPLGGHLSETGRFVRHLVEMVLAMMVGMIAGAAVFLGATGLTLEQALRRHAVLFVVVQALAMTVVMVAWMRHRGHVWRGCAEMAAAMVLPAVALVCLRLAGIVSGPICGGYCALTVVAMVLVMLYRRSDYAGIASAAPAR